MSKHKPFSAGQKYVLRVLVFSLPHIRPMKSNWTGGEMIGLPHKEMVTKRQQNRVITAT